MAYTIIAIPNILVTSKSPIVTWQGPHYKFMKLIMCLDLDIHKSKETIVVTHESKANIANCSFFLATNERMIC